MYSKKYMNDGHSAAWDQQWDKAAVLYSAALQEFPDHPKALNSLALAQYQLARYEEALETYQRVAKLSPDDPIPMEHIAQTLGTGWANIKRRWRRPCARPTFISTCAKWRKPSRTGSYVTTLNPEHVAAHSRLALIHEQLGQVKPAIIEYLAVASLLQRADSPQKTMELIDQALSISPDSRKQSRLTPCFDRGSCCPNLCAKEAAPGPLRMAQVKQLDAPDVHRQHPGSDRGGAPEGATRWRRSCLNTTMRVLKPRSGADCRRSCKAPGSST